MTVTHNGLHLQPEVYHFKDPHIYINKARRQGFSSLTYDLLTARLEALLEEQRDELYRN